jgi:hypothetical protein
MSELIYHNCPENGEMYIEEGNPCNWCDELDPKEAVILEFPMIKDTPTIKT